MTRNGASHDFRKLWIVLLVMAILSPIGLYLPELLKAGSAWGEWGVDEIRKMVGYVPEGMKKDADLWKAPLPDYALRGQDGAPVSRHGLSYILSAFIGILICAGGTWLLLRLLTRKK